MKAKTDTQQLPATRTTRLLRVLVASLIAVSAAIVGTTADAAPTHSEALRQVTAGTVSRTLSPASIAPSATSSAIVGNWRGDVYRDDGTVERNVTLQFFPDGTVNTVGAIGTATGTWTHVVNQVFTYRTTETLEFGSLEVTGYVLVTGTTLAGVGQGRALDPFGHLLGTGRSAIVAYRQ